MARRTPPFNLSLRLQVLAFYNTASLYKCSINSFTFLTQCSTAPRNYIFCCRSAIYIYQNEVLVIMEGDDDVRIRWKAGRKTLTMGTLWEWEVGSKVDEAAVKCSSFSWSSSRCFSSCSRTPVVWNIPLKPWSSVHLICFDHPSISGRSSFRLFLAAITLLLPPGVTVSPYWANKWFSFGQTSRCWGPPPWFGWLPFASRSHWNGRHRWLCTVWCWRRNSCLPDSQCRQSRIAEALLLHKEM